MESFLPRFIFCEIDRKLLNALGLSSIIKSKENAIKSLQGKIEYMKKQW